MSEAERWLRRQFAAHNRLVCQLGALTVLGVAAVWVLGYVVCVWLWLLALSIAGKFDAEPPHWLGAAYIYAAGLLVLIAWIGKLRHPDHRPGDKKQTLDYTVDVLLALPRATLAVWENFAAWQSLAAVEFREAAGLIEHLARLRRVPVQALAQELPDAVRRGRIVAALQLIHIVEQRSDEGVIWLVLTARHECRLAQR